MILRLPLIGQSLDDDSEIKQLFLYFLVGFGDHTRFKILVKNVFYVDQFGHLDQAHIFFILKYGLEVLISVLIERSLVSRKSKVVENVEKQVAKRYEIVSPRGDFEVHLMLRGKSYVSLESTVFLFTLINMVPIFVQILRCETKINQDGVINSKLIWFYHDVWKFEVVIGSIRGMNNLKLVYHLCCQ